MGCKVLEPDVVSAYCLELFLNFILLHLLVDKSTIALKHFDQAKAEESPATTTTHTFRGILL